jgi:hypothetical protein
VQKTQRTEPQIPRIFNFCFMPRRSANVGGSEFQIFKKLTLPIFPRTLAIMASRKKQLSREESNSPGSFATGVNLDFAAGVGI